MPDAVTVDVHIYVCDGDKAPVFPDDDYEWIEVTTFGELADDKRVFIRGLKKSLENKERTGKHE